MKVKTLICAVVLGIYPAVVSATGCWSHEQQVQSCAQGTVWDSESLRCVEVVNS